MNNTKIEGLCKIFDATVKDHVRIAPISYIRNSSIGRGTVINQNSYIFYADIGNYCQIAWNVTIGARLHPYQSISNYGEVTPTDRMSIGSDVWIGCNAVLMPDIKVGNGAVIGAGAVVTHDVPDYSIVGGVPAKIIKYRFPEDIVKRLLDIRWWEIPFEVFSANRSLFRSELNEETLNKVLDLKKESTSTNK
jgi:acetyltransferase-like isoleucine patch superfamily enzyme